MKDTNVAAFTNDLLIVIVCYNVSIKNCAAYHSIVEGLNAGMLRSLMLVYDNSPERSDELLASSNSDFLYEHDVLNGGVSKAYNYGFDVARQRRKKWMLLADQDTTFPLSFFSSLADGIGNFPHVKLFAPLVKDKHGIVSPFRWQWGKGFRVSKVNAGVQSLHDLLVINSGLCISVDLFEQCGGYNEKFPLDLSDVVFLEIASQYSSDFVLVNDCLLHRLSSEEGQPEVTLQRFKVYCHAVRQYASLAENSVMVIFFLMMRSLKLSVKFFDIRYLFAAMNGSSKLNW